MVTAEALSVTTVKPKNTRNTQSFLFLLISWVELIADALLLLPPSSLFFPFFCEPKTTLFY